MFYGSHSQHLSLGAAPSIGALMGTAGSSAVVERLNRSIGSVDSVYSTDREDPFRSHYKFFMKNVVEKVVDANEIIMDTIGTAGSREAYPWVEHYDDLRSLPATMHMPMITYEPVRQLLKEGKINGFDYKAENLPDDDVYDRLIHNGEIEFDGENYNKHCFVDDEGVPHYVQEFRGDDPTLTDRELGCIRQLRMVIDDAIANGNDPTEYGEEIGCLEPVD